MQKKPLDKRQDRAFREVLKPLLEKYPGARVDIYRRNLHAIRVRIVHPGFRNMNRVERDDLLWKYLENLPEDILQNITMLLVLTPDEEEESFANYDFEHPLPSAIL